MNSFARFLASIALGMITIGCPAFAAEHNTSETLCGASHTNQDDPIINQLFKANNALCKRIAAQLLNQDAIDIESEVKNLNSVLTENTEIILSFFNRSHEQYPALKLVVTNFMKEFQSKLVAEIKTNNSFDRLYSLKTGDRDFNLVWEISGLGYTESLEEFKATEADKGICQTLSAGDKLQQYPNCKVAFNAISTGVNTYRKAYDLIYVKTNQILLNGLKLDWQRYVNTARNQTWLDETFDFWLQKHHYSSDYLVGPSKVQYFILHPSLVYEWVDSEPDGQKDKAIPALELLGFNRWDDRFPWGLSVVALASDRVNYQALSFGLTAYLDNKYSFGAAYRKAEDNNSGVEDEWSIYLNIDLLNFARQRKNQFDTYQQTLRQTP